jgi:hypothetical protein
MIYSVFRLLDVVSVSEECFTSRGSLEHAKE